MIKLKWKVGDKPTGRYRSFEKRSWPYAYYPDGTYAGSIDCSKSYEPRDAREGTHPELTILVADHSDQEGGAAWVSKRLKQKFKTLDEAKQGLSDIIHKYPQLMPRNYRE